jgi:Zn-dependent membrane protease YugP
MLFLLIGFAMINTSLLPLEIAIGLYAVTTLFTIITLPVEMDASNRALNWIDENNIVHGEEYNNAKSALQLAAFTYVLAALASLTELLRLISIVNSRKE